MNNNNNNNKVYWKDIPGYEGLYQVSTNGKIRRCKRIVVYKNGSERVLKSKILKPNYSGSGYLKVGLYKNKVRKTFNVHVLIGITFLNHKPNGFNRVVNHINHKRSDNNISNLEIISQRQNANKKHIKSKSKYVGVHYLKNNKKWMARIVKNNKRIYLGVFKDEYSAHLAYQKELNKINNHE